MIAILKGEKVRPVPNVSKPCGKLFNNNIDKYQVERIVMDTGEIVHLHNDQSRHQCLD